MLVRLTEHVLLAQSGFSLTNTVVVLGPRDTALLVDPGVTGPELTALAGRLAAYRIVAGLATHGHWDHVLWHPGFGVAPRYAAPAAIAACAAERQTPGWAQEVRRDGPGEDPVLRSLAGAPLAPLRTVPVGEPAHDRAPRQVEIPDWAGPPVRVVGHDGHAPGHRAFLVDGVLIAGDMLSDTEIPLPDLTAADPVGDYRAGLHALARLLIGATVVVPGHGHWTDASGARRRLAADRTYLDAATASAEPADDSPARDPRLRAASSPAWLRQADTDLRRRLREAPAGT